MKEVKDALKILLQGESDAVIMYSAFSKKAEEEGFKNTAILFKALAAAERIHIKNHRNALGEEFEPTKTEEFTVGTTLENLTNAIEGESEEAKELYPRLIKSIKKYTKEEYGKVARLSMNWARIVEKEHARLLKLALRGVKNGKDLDINVISVCQVCGNVVLDSDNKKVCKVCGHDEIFFTSVTLEA